MSEELFNILANPERFGRVFWNCDCCLTSIVRLERHVVDVEKRVKEVETMATNTVGELKKVDEVVAQLRKEFDLERERTRGKQISMVPVLAV